MTEFKIATNQQDIDGAYDLRKIVFVDEQKVPEEMNIDEFDKDAIHVVAKRDNKIIGTSRMVVEGDKGKIGRMAVEKDLRKQGIGKELLTLLEQEARKRKLKEIYLHSQFHAKSFYERLGYQPRGEVFTEVGIDHIEMYKTLNS
jgi:predicted GNAT family N-acyltransferase